MPEMRRDPVTGNWVIIATERSRRPNDFVLPTEQKKGGTCVFCWGNEDKTPPEVLAWRPQGGVADSPGWTVRAFPNKFPAVSSGPGLIGFDDLQTGDNIPAVGIHEVIVDCPEHTGSLGAVSNEQSAQVFRVIAERYKTLSKDPGVKYIQVFKNSGAVAGASLEHSHWQIITVPVIPQVFRQEFAGVKRCYEENGTCVFCQIISQEIICDTRLIELLKDFIVVSPFAPRFPYEMWILPRRHDADFGCMSEDETKVLGNLVRRTVRRLETAFKHPPFNIVLHTSPPCKGYELYHWHIEVLPRLSIAAGFEWGAGIFINPASPEAAAKILREIDPQT